MLRHSCPLIPRSYFKTPGGIFVERSTQSCYLDLCLSAILSLETDQIKFLFSFALPCPLDGSIFRPLWNPEFAPGIIDYACLAKTWQCSLELKRHEKLKAENEQKPSVHGMVLHGFAMLLGLFFCCFCWWFLYTFPLDKPSLRPTKPKVFSSPMSCLIFGHPQVLICNSPLVSFFWGDMLIMSWMESTPSFWSKQHLKNHQCQTVWPCLWWTFSTSNLQMSLFQKTPKIIQNWRRNERCPTHKQQIGSNNSSWAKCSEKLQNVWFSLWNWYLWLRMT